MLTYNLTVQISKYIGDPYWPEQFRLIEITKESGMNRVRASQNKRKALEEYLKSKGMTLDDYTVLETAAKRPFHVNAEGFIIIPAERVFSFLVATCDTVRAAMRPCSKEQVRSRFEVSDWITTKTGPDGIWSRFATVTSGPGGKLSNQRGLRENPYIENALATGSLSCDPDFVNVKTLHNAIEWGGAMVGIGASRKMGMGRFAITKFELV
jgi:hypothetical protein